MQLLQRCIRFFKVFAKSVFRSLRCSFSRNIGQTDGETTLNEISHATKMRLEPWQTSKMEHFAKIVHYF